jgi:PadR family transcriptional regulator PadR
VLSLISKQKYPKEVHDFFIDLDNLMLFIPLYFVILCIIKLKVMISKTLTAASTKPIILSILKQGNSYGYLIIKKIKEISGGQMSYTDGMLYPVLHRLEKEGLIQSNWTVEDDTRPRKYYQITDLGKQALVVEQQQWAHVTAVLEGLWMKPTTK